MHDSAVPLNMQLMPQQGSVPFVCVAFSDGSVKLIDYMNEDN